MFPSSALNLPRHSTFTGCWGSYIRQEAILSQLMLSNRSFSPALPPGVSGKERSLRACVEMLYLIFSLVRGIDGKCKVNDNIAKTIASYIQLAYKSFNQSSSYILYVVSS